MKAIFAFVMIYTVVCFAQNQTANYLDLNTNFFLSEKSPLEIVIFPFTTKGIETDYAKTFYDSLVTRMGKSDKYIINYYAKLNSLLKQWGIKEWNPNNKKLVEKLFKVLDIKFIVYAEMQDNSGNGFNLVIKSTRTNSIVFSCEYKESHNSTPIKDAVFLFSNFKSVSYSDKPQDISFTLTTTPNSAFLVYLDEQYIGITPIKYKIIKKKSTKLRISDPNNLFYDYTETIPLDVITENEYNRNIALTYKGGSPKTEDNTTTYNNNYNNNSNYSSRYKYPKDPKWFLTLLYFTSGPQGDFEGESQTQSGYALAGSGGGIDIDIPIADHVNIMFSGLYTTNPYQNNLVGIPESDELSHKFGLILTGLRATYEDSQRIGGLYILGEVGLLIDRYPDIEYSKIYYPYYNITKVSTSSSNSLVYGIGAGIYFTVLDIGVRYFYSTPELTFNATTTSQYPPYSTTTIEKKMVKPYSSVWVTFGLRL